METSSLSRDEAVEHHAAKLDKMCSRSIVIDLQAGRLTGLGGPTGITPWYTGPKFTALPFK